MQISRRALLASSACAASATVAGPVLAKPHAHHGAPHGSASAQLNAFLKDALEALLSEIPENATFRGVDTGPRARLRHLVTDRSDEGSARRGTAYAQRVQRLKAIDRSKLTDLDAVNYDVALEAHEEALEGSKFGYGDDLVLSAQWGENNSPYAVSQMTGAFQTLPDFLDSIHPIETKDDADAYLERVEGFARQLDQESVRLPADAARGVLAPDFIIDNILGQYADFLGKPAADWTLVKSLQRRAREKAVPGDHGARVLALCEQRVRPALTHQVEVLKGLRAKAKADAGCWKLPQGDAYYAWQLRCGTTTPMNPDEIHRMGLAQVAELEARMDELLTKQGVTGGTPGQRMAMLGKDPRFLYPNTDAGRAQLIDYLNGRIAAVRPRLKDAFYTLPAAKAVVRRVPPEIQDGAANGYEYDGSIDGSRPATYYINLKSTRNWPKFALPTLTFHETVPGHVWQGDYASHLPLVRSLMQFNAYVEGWALYAEQLADELGMYDDDPFGRLGYLQALQFRACRLVVDTGLHAKRWTREQALQYLLDHSGRPTGALTGEVDRYCATPGQACGYKVGHSEILRLREKTKAALGPKFDVKRFNDLMVLSGSVPLTTLGRIVDDEIARAQKA
ncbi:MAG: DUF885 family protein [Proteobacteria bacterium]|nr:DUF885 family protein [Pseudomonadota bacterium]